MPARSFAAGFLIATNFAKPGTRNEPVFLSSLQPTIASVSMMPLSETPSDQLMVVVERGQD
jgi:hypothetical protein